MNIYNFVYFGGGNCSCCGAPGTNKSTCPFNPDSKKPNTKPGKHNKVPFPQGCKGTTQSTTKKAVTKKQPSPKKATPPKVPTPPVKKPGPKKTTLPVRKPGPKRITIKKQAIVTQKPKAVPTISQMKIMKKDPSKRSYTESQKSAHCLKHAINHILQRGIVSAVIGSENESDLFWQCQKRLKEFYAAADPTELIKMISMNPREIIKREGNKLGLCSLSGMFQLELGIDIIKSLGYPVNDSPELSERNNIDWDNNVTHVGIDWKLWANDLKRPDYLGTIIGDGGHFTAVVKNIRECDEFGGYAYIDSFTSTQFNCGTIEQMREYIKNKIKPKRVVNVFQKP